MNPLECARGEITHLFHDDVLEREKEAFVDIIKGFAKIAYACADDDATLLAGEIVGLLTSNESACLAQARELLDGLDACLVALPFPTLCFLKFHVIRACAMYVKN